MNQENFHKQPTEPGVAPEEKITKPPEIPKKIGRYTVESLLEKGGMSLLYLGTDPETKAPTTIKVISPKYASNPEVVQRFLKEAEIIKMADHPNIIKLYGYGEWEGGLFIAMEFIEGITLRQYILQHPDITLRHALEIIIDVAYALCHLHTHGVIHRDLKPENILMTKDNEIKVIDFGIAQLLTESPEPGALPRQRLIGTPIYMSPEQRENPESVSFPSDIYSLGIVSYELILGKLSHGRLKLSLIPKGIQSILVRALQPKPDNRYQDVVDFITDISQYLKTLITEEEKKMTDQLSEISEDLTHVQELFIPEKLPEWPNLGIGLVTKRKSLSVIYYDFFELSEVRYSIIMGESSSKGPEAVITTALLRGMTRALHKLATKPIELVTVLNELLLKDHLGPVFALSYLILSPNDNQLHFISCGYGNLWRISKEIEEPKKLTTNNIAIGIDPKTDFSEITESWETGDTLVLNSFASISDEKDEPKFIETLKETVDQSPQQQVESLQNKIETDKAYALIFVKRR